MDSKQHKGNLRGQIKNKVQRRLYNKRSRKDASNAIHEGEDDILNSREFYDVMQCYRHSTLLPHNAVDAFEEVKQWLRDNYPPDKVDSHAADADAISVPMSVVEQVLRYCEDNAIYDKLGRYQDFYYKLNQLKKQYADGLPKVKLFVCEYCNPNGSMPRECEIKARNMEEAVAHFKFFYPKKKLRSSTLKIVKS